jgi:RimJ/RimL family protein N-acetyltransferase
MIDVEIALAPLDSLDAELARAWRNDYRIWRWCRQSDLISDVQQKAWFERQNADSSIRMYKLVLKANGSEKPLGVCGLTSIDWLNRRAEFSLYVRPDCQRRGYARAGLSLLLDHAFKNLGLHQVWGETFVSNPALKLFEQLGFKLDGLRRQFYWKDGAFIDAYVISMLSGEWHALRNPSSDRSRDTPPSPGLPEAKPSSSDGAGAKDGPEGGEAA